MEERSCPKIGRSQKCLPWSGGPRVCLSTCVRSAGKWGDSSIPNLLLRIPFWCPEGTQNLCLISTSMMLVQVHLGPPFENHCAKLRRVFRTQEVEGNSGRPFQGLVLDFHSFQTESHLRCCVRQGGYRGTVGTFYTSSWAVLEIEHIFRTYNTV